MHSQCGVVHRMYHQLYQSRKSTRHMRPLFEMNTIGWVLSACRFLSGFVAPQTVRFTTGRRQAAHVHFPFKRWLSAAAIVIPRSLSPGLYVASRAVVCRWLSSLLDRSFDRISMQFLSMQLQGSLYKKLSVLGPMCQNRTNAESQSVTPALLSQNGEKHARSNPNPAVLSGHKRDLKSFLETLGVSLGKRQRDALSLCESAKIGFSWHNPDSQNSGVTRSFPFFFRIHLRNVGLKSKRKPPSFDLTSL